MMLHGQEGLDGYGLLCFTHTHAIKISSPDSPDDIMVRLQSVFPYLILLAVCTCVIILLYVSSPTRISSDRVHDEFPLHREPYKKIVSSIKEIHARQKEQTTEDTLSDKGDTDKEVGDKGNDFHYLKEILVGSDTYYKPVNIYKLKNAEEKFTILIQTFNRTDLLMRVLNHFSAVRGVDRIIVVWNTMGEEPPYDWWEGLQPHPAEVVFLEQSENKVRNRLHRFPEIRTEGVLMLDDDHLYATRDVEFAFRVWKQYRNKLVGFVARKHVEVSEGVYVYGDFDMNTDTPLGGYAYSFVLIGATFFHRDYLDMFNSEEVPPSVHELIDSRENCDDLAFNFMVGRHLAKTSETDQCVGVYVSPTVTKNIENIAVSGYTGKWKNPEHFATRSYCINALAKLYSGVPLPYCDMILTSYFDYTRLKQC